MYGFQQLYSTRFEFDGDDSSSVKFNDASAADHRSFLITVQSTFKSVCDAAAALLQTKDYDSKEYLSQHG